MRIAFVVVCVLFKGGGLLLAQPVEAADVECASTVGDRGVGGLLHVALPEQGSGLSVRLRWNIL